MTPFTSFYPYILPDVPGCPSLSVDQALSSTLIDFCEKTLILQADMDPVTIVKGVVDYDLEPPKDHLVTKIMKVFYRSNEIRPTSPDDIMSASLYNKNYPEAKPEEGPPKLYTQKDARTFSIYPYPKETEKLALTLRVALKPTRSATQCDDILFEEYAEIIGHGVVSRLALSSNKPYSDPKLAGVKNVMYTAGINLARQRANRGYVRSNTQVRIRKI